MITDTETMKTLILQINRYNKTHPSTLIYIPNVIIEMSLQTTPTG